MGFPVSITSEHITQDHERLGKPPLEDDCFLDLSAGDALSWLELSVAAGLVDLCVEFGSRDLLLWEVTGEICLLDGDLEPEGVFSGLGRCIETGSSKNSNWIFGRYGVSAGWMLSGSS